MAKPEQGRIVLAEIPDPQNRNPKIRPVVIVNPSDEIAAGKGILVVGITSTLPRKLPENCVLLSFHAAGHTHTGLKKRCAAMCSWLVEIEESQIIKFIGKTSVRELEEILTILESMES